MHPCGFPSSSSWRRRSRGLWLRALVLGVVLATPVAFAQEQPPAAPPRQLSFENTPWKGDFAQMLQRRILRVLIPYSRTLFFNDKGRERGITADHRGVCEAIPTQEDARDVGQGPLTVLPPPTPRDRVFRQPNAGLGHIGGGNITGTEGRLKLGDFGPPKDGPPLQELLATGPKA